MSSIRRGDERPGSFCGAFDSEAAASCSENEGQGRMLGAPEFQVETPLRSPGEPEVMEQTGSMRAHKAGYVALAWPTQVVLIEPPCSWPPQHFKER